MTKPLSFLWLVILFIVLGIALFYCLQRTLIYAPSKVTPNKATFHAKYMQDIALSTKDGLTLNAWYTPAKPKKPTLIVFHGNAGHIGTRVPLARELSKQGFGVLLLEYRGYGGNPGKPTEQGFYHDARAGMHFLNQEEHIPISHIALYGESLGTGVAVQMATEYPKVCALVLQSPYTTLEALGRYHYAWMPFPPWDKFDSLKKIKTIHTPLLALHGNKDYVVPYQQGQALFAAANPPKQWLTLHDQGHNGLWTPRFIQTVNTFVETHCQSL